MKLKILLCLIAVYLGVGAVIALTSPCGYCTSDTQELLLLIAIMIAWPVARG